MDFFSVSSAAISNSSRAVLYRSVTVSMRESAVLVEEEDEGAELELARRMWSCVVVTVGGVRSRRKEVRDGQRRLVRVEMEVR